VGAGGGLVGRQRAGNGGAGWAVTAIPVSAGTIASQILGNSDASGPAVNPCGVIGGRAKWFALRPQASGLLRVDTLGSDIDTVLAVYSWAETMGAPLQYLTCDNNSAPDGRRSVAILPATSGTLYYLAADGVNGEKGTISLNCLLAEPMLVAPVSSPTQYVRAGTSARLAVTISNATPDLCFQWLKYGQPLPGATNSELVLANFVANQAGNYSVVISNFAEVITQAVAVLVEDVPVRFTWALLTNGQFQLRCSSASQSYVVQAATNLNQSLTNPAAWLPVLTNLIPNSPLDFVDTNAVLYRQRYYRAVLLNLTTNGH
jgi:hypothetical protein